MLYCVPEAKASAIAELDRLRIQLGGEVQRGRPWMGPIRRTARAVTARSSVAIEGFEVTPEIALTLVEGGSPTDADQRALAGYSLAMDHVAVLADDPWFSWSDRVILDLHFEACASQPGAGRLRTGPVWVTAPGGGVAYRAPDAEEARALLLELVAWLAATDVAPVVRAAMAHLHLVSIHPFADGNGRISRILQSLVLARDGVLCPELGSIEEHLAANTSGYYAVLQEVQGGSYQPGRDAGPWVRFCLDAHRAAALARIATIERAAHRWEILEGLVENRGWPDRLVVALEQACASPVDRGAYASEAGVSPATASADLRRLVDAGLLVRQGSTRDARYSLSDTLRRLVGA